MTITEIHFDGADYQPTLDQQRLTGQLDTIRSIMLDQRWHTVDDIVAKTRFPANSVQAQLRNLRKPRFGGYQVEKRRVTDTGLYEYRLGHSHYYAEQPKPQTVTITISREDAKWMLENRYLSFDAFQQLRKALGA